MKTALLWMLIVFIGIASLICLMILVLLVELIYQEVVEAKMKNAKSLKNDYLE